MKQITSKKNQRAAAKRSAGAAQARRREREALVRAAWTETTTAAEMAKAVGLSLRTVREYCQAMGLPLQHAQREYRSPLSAQWEVSPLARSLSRRRWALDDSAS